MKILSILFLAAGLTAAAVAKQPNIVFMMADDHQAMAMGCAGNPSVHTPNMDKLAEKGILFQRAYASSPLCYASRATVMTGMREYKTGANFHIGRLSAENWHSMAYPVLLKQAGYRLGFAGKWGFDQQVKDVSTVFDRWGSFASSGQGHYQTEKIATLKEYAADYPHVSRAIGAFGRDFIRESATGDAPFCLSLSFKAPHTPHQYVDPITEDLYKDITFPHPPTFGPEFSSKLPLQARISRQYLQRANWDAAHYQDHLRIYYQLISGVDAAIGMVVEELEKAGVADNTVIIYTSDNGYFCGSHGMQGKVLPYEEASRIPLIIYDPRNPAKGKQAPGLACNTDFMPTILDLAGLPIPEKVDGVSLVPIINNPEERVREWMPLIQNWGWADNDHSRALSIVTEQWKYINWVYVDENVPAAEELFNMKNDPYEVSNVIENPEHEPVLEKLRKHYDAIQKHWAATCEDNPKVVRTGAILDRHTPWQEKPFKTFPADPPKKGGVPIIGMQQLYAELTGKECKTMDPVQ